MAFLGQEEQVREYQDRFRYLYLAVFIGLGFLLYLPGYAIVGPLCAIPPIAWLRTWLYRRMYFDELYEHILIIPLRNGLSGLAGWFDKYIVDGFVNLVGWSVHSVSRLAGLNDRYVIDGSVNGVADLTQNLGAAVRAPQTGRIRMYVTILIAAISIGLAIAIIVTLS